MNSFDTIKTIRVTEKGARQSEKFGYEIEISSIDLLVSFRNTS